MPFGWALRLAGKSGPDGRTLLALTLFVLLHGAAYRVLLPLALRLLEQRRELVLRAVTRE
jgi:ABC-2 type transport system permease protein